MVLIIGAGPIGLATGIELKRRNIPFLIIEKGALTNSLFHYPVNMTFFSTSEKLEIGDVPFISHGPKPTRSEALEYYRRVAEKWELPIHLYEEVTSLDGEQGAFTVTTRKATYQASHVVVATGFYGVPKRMNVPGEDLPKVSHYYNEPHPYTWKNVLVVGAGNSGVDVALETWRCNAHVTMAIRDDSIKDTVKYWVRPDIENRIKNGEITAWFNTRVKEIRETEVDLETPDGVKTIPNDFVLAMTGYLPHFEFMEMLGIELSTDGQRKPEFDEDSLETNRRGIFVAGVVCGGMDTSSLFIENSRVHAVRIAESIERRTIKND
ncbi:MAG: YpdA family putative bacillithiol disulfide reductase [Balneolaceae bacterium]